jgi:hypothetical protein
LATLIFLQYVLLEILKAAFIHRSGTDGSFYILLELIELFRPDVSTGNTRKYCNIKSRGD